MLSSIKIENYRNLASLEIAELSRINLFVGKNNTGKTSVLEAISMLAVNSKTFPDYTILSGWIYKILYNRDQKAFINNDFKRNDFTDFNLQILNSLLYGRNSEFFSGFSIMAKNSDYYRFGPDHYAEQIRLRYIASFMHQVAEVDEEGNSKAYYRNEIADNQQQLDSYNFRIEYLKKLLHLQTQHNGSGYGQPMAVENRSGDIMSSALIKLNRGNIQFVTTKDFDEDISLILYDRIIFEQSKMDQVHDALRLIEPSLEKFAFQTNDSGQRIGRIKVKDNRELFSIGNMGDGMNRILNIILAAVNCQDGYLFIDEFENGLHFSVQKQLWNIIFYLAETLNIQVFTTTHSNDTINSLVEVLEERKDQVPLAKVIRLQRLHGIVVAVDYNKDELETSTDFGIEIR